MFKVLIELDDKKIISDKKYSVETVYEAVDGIFKRFENLKKESVGIYTATGKQHDFAHMWSAIMGLRKQDWFKPYVKSWKWFNGNNSSEDNPEGMEDLMEILGAGVNN